MSRILFALLLALCGTVSYGADDLLIADFEGPNYGEWKVEGEAFGPGPARGTLPGQMPVSGFQGQGLVNSFFQGDRTTGKLISPAFVIERPWINFLIGGGQHQDQLVIKLLVDGQAVRTSSGPNNTAGGTEALNWDSWDVSSMLGKKATIEIIDQATGGWGHINVDQITQSETRKASLPAERQIEITRKFLHLPVKTGAPKRKMRFSLEGKTVREFEIEYAEGSPDFLTLSDVSSFVGKTLKIQIDRIEGGPEALAAITQSDDKPAASEIYRERLRPQFHFTSQRGWLNDPNGLVYANGKYHLFYQHNPYGWSWGNMHWGHAVSTDLLHWEELPESVYPPRFGDWAFSGSAVVDPKNTTGSGGSRHGTEAIIAAFTSTGRGECLLSSFDNGITWTEFPENPVVKHQGRDPRLLWHAPTQKWVMAIYDEFEGKQWIVFHTSNDMHTWEFASRIEGFYECPDLFEARVQGSEETRWVLYAADGKYVTGQFDGRIFTPDGPKQQLWHGNFYAAQTYSNDPLGRIIQIGWGQGIEFPQMPFNQQMVVPVELTLHKQDGRFEMRAAPIRELSQLQDSTRREVKLSAAGGEAQTIVEVHNGSRWTLSVHFERGGLATLDLGGVKIQIDADRGQLTCQKVTVPITLKNKTAQLDLLMDNGSIEMFFNEGATAVSIGANLSAKRKVFRLTEQGGPVTVTLSGHDLRSVWRK